MSLTDEQIADALGALEDGAVLVRPGDLLGPGDAAAIIGVDRSTVSRWIREGYMPEPLQVLMLRGAKGVPVWTRPTITKFAAEHHGRSDAAGRRPLGTAQR